MGLLQSRPVLPSSGSSRMQSFRTFIDRASATLASRRSACPCSANPKLGSASEPKDAAQGVQIVLESPSVVSFFDNDSSFDSEASSIASSRCPSLHLDLDAPMEQELLAPGNVPVVKVIPPTPGAEFGSSALAGEGTGVGTEALLARYSHQELVLLEFWTHTANMSSQSIEDALVKFPPGFTRASAGHEGLGADLCDCEACSLMDAYLEFSFKRATESDILVA